MNLTNGQYKTRRFIAKSLPSSKDIHRDPISGLGKPEALKHELSGLWSRRISDEHRLVYSITDEEIVVVSCKFHY